MSKGERGCDCGGFEVFSDDIEVGVKNVHKLIVLRGNSGSGKTTAVKELQQLLGNNTMIISQDVVRRDRLSPKNHWMKKLDFI